MLASGTWCTIADLSNSSEYTVTVRAVNAVGTGPPSQPSGPVTPAPLPGQPANVVGVAGDGVVAVSWTPSDENRGPPVRRFTATAGPTGPESPATGPGLLVWDPTPATVTLGQVMIATTPSSEGAETGSGGVVTPDAGTGVAEPGSGGWSAGTAEVKVEVEVNAARGLVAWCRALGGIEGYSVMLFISQASGAVVIPGGWSAGSGPAAGLGSLGHSTVARFTVAVPTDLTVGRHRVGGSCRRSCGRTRPHRHPRCRSCTL